MHIRRILVVHRKSFFQMYMAEKPDPALARSARRGDPMMPIFEESHRINQEALERLQRLLDEAGVEVVTRTRRQVRSTRGFDLVISLGGDGTLMDTAGRLGSELPLMGINADPRRSVGALCAGTVLDLPSILDDLREGRLAPRPLNRLRIRREGQLILGPALNDLLFAHRCPAGLTRFEMAILETAEAEAWTVAEGPPLPVYRCSGLWVSTATGSTAAIRSAGGQPMSAASKALQFLVREPFMHPLRPRPEPLRGFVQPGQAMLLISRLRNGRVWADGVEHTRPVAFGERLLLDNHPCPIWLIRP